MEKKNFFGWIAKIILIYIMIILFLTITLNLLEVINNGLQNNGLKEVIVKANEVNWYLTHPNRYLITLSDKVVNFKINIIDELLLLINNKMNISQPNLYQILYSFIQLIVYLILYILINKNQKGHLIITTILYILLLMIFIQFNIIYAFICLVAVSRKLFN
ncbi:hypothetical protein BN85412070 [Alteracholeplasma palmae J233]|uniref:Uncharacterized protein n=1 Tax=Alteracholeplasma palmae (strain ATCC 49389 / J233) TaxID=1318466 RepID=U4KLG7_ALTPJ|nr:hypothetical protein [Alteracholeplasma palmae]CCV64784.1 hypothetical protein BN85412070 [Alteracholeplasma palmae J233]